MSAFSAETTARNFSLFLTGLFLLLLLGKHDSGPALAQNEIATGQLPPASDRRGESETFRSYLPITMSSMVGQLHMWLSPEELASVPTSGEAWDNLFEAAQEDTGDPDISDQDDRTNVYVLAKALVYARTGDPSYRQEVVQAIEAVIGTEQGGRTLAAGRNLAAFIIAADLIDLSTTPDIDLTFRAWLADLLTTDLDGDTLQTTHELRANNWGTHAGASRAAIAIYLGDRAELARTVQVFKGFLGDRDAYAGFNFGDLWWQCDPQNPVGINPAGCMIDGHSVDGVIPDEQRRGGDFQWPPPKENYAWGGLQGALVQAQLLHRAGYPAWEWEDAALLRAVTWLHEQAEYPAEGDDEWQPWLINSVYGTDFPTEMPASPGKNVGWTDWTAPAQP